MLASLLVTLALTTTTPARAADWPDLSTSPRGTREGANDAAVLIAIEDYPFVDDVAGAGANVDAWMAWLKNGRGVPLARMQVVRDRDANARRIREAVSAAAAQVGPAGTLWFVFIGHGAPSKDGRDGLLVGANADRTAEGIYYESVPRAEVMAALGASPAARAVAVLDACFSGQSGSGQALVSGLQPLVPTALLAAAPSKVTVLTAAGSGEFAGPLAGSARPAFSYLALGALRGWADADGGNGDGTVSAREVLDYTRGALVATVRGRTQTPTLIGQDVALSAVIDRGAPPDLLGMGRGATSTSVSSTATGGTAAGDMSADVAALKRLKALREARESKLTELARAKAAEGAAAWTELSSVLSDGSAAEIAVVEKYVKTWTDAKVWVDDAEGRTERAVVVASIDAAKAWLAKAGKGATGSDWVSPSLGTMKWIPAGTFMMGSPASEAGRDSDETQHRVTLTKGFWMMEHEVTQGEWQAVMGSNPATRPEGECSRWGNKAAPASNEPVYCVAWDEAAEFARRVSARDGVTYALPTEAQWEFAARGNGTGVYAGGNEVGAVAWTFENSGGRTHPVCQKARNGYGLCDMSGNVWEWTADWMGDYPSSAVTDPTGAPAGAYRVRRGGSWNDDPRLARVADRGGYDPADRGGNLGFRFSRTVP